MDFYEYKPHMDKVFNHMETYFGKDPVETRKEDKTRVFVNKYAGVPDKDMTTFITYGLSYHELRQPKSDTFLRQELLMNVDNDFSVYKLQKALFVMSKMILDKHLAIPRGQVIGPAGPLFDDIPDCNCTALFFTAPGYFLEEFHAIEDESPNIFFVEAIPVTTEEALLIRQKGWSHFETLLGDGEIDYLDLLRK